MHCSLNDITSAIVHLPSNYSAVPMLRKDATNIFEHTRHRATRNSLSYEWDTTRSLNQTRMNIGDFSSFSMPFYRLSEIEKRYN